MTRLLLFVSFQFRKSIILTVFVIPKFPGLGHRHWRKRPDLVIWDLRIANASSDNSYWYEYGLPV